MNAPRRRTTQVAPPIDEPSPPAQQPWRDKLSTHVQRNADLAIDTLGLLLLRIGESAPAILAWMLHENIRTLVHRPPDIMASLAWLAGFTLLSLSARLAARRLRDRRAMEQVEDLLDD